MEAPSSAVQVWVESHRVAKMHQPLLAHPSLSTSSPLQAVQALTACIRSPMSAYLLCVVTLLDVARLSFKLTLC